MLLVYSVTALTILLVYENRHRIETILSLRLSFTYTKFPIIDDDTM